MSLRAIGLPVLFLSLFSPSVFAAEKLVFNNSELTVKDSSITVSHQGKQIIELEDIQFNYESITNWKVIKQDENNIIIESTLPASADFYRTAFDEKEREIRLRVSSTASGFRLYAKPEWGRQVQLVFKHLNDHFFGLSEPLQPNNQLSPDLSGATITVDVASEAAQLRENYASAYSAFYISSHGYGAFFDTFARGSYGFDINGKNTIQHDTGTLDWHIFPGNNGAQIHKAYYSVIGKPKSVPMWALGPIGWRDDNRGGAAEIVEDIAQMSALKIPFTGWFVDRPYSDGGHAWSKMNFATPFANPEEWIGKINNDYGMEFMTWVATAIFETDRFEKQFDGSYSYIDLSHPPSVAQYQQELKQKQYQYGVKGHKIDRADEVFPEHEKWHDGTPPAERRNKNAYLTAKVIDEALKESWGDNNFNFARSAYHRSQPYLSAIWGGDPRSTWDGLQANFANAMRSSFIGFPIWGTDVGGYLNEGFIPEDLYIRWLQAGSMTGFFEIKLDGAGGDGRDRMPWRYGKQLQQRFKEICEDRMLMLPYLYSLALTSAQNGTLMQPMAYRHFNDKNTFDIWDQFYLGEALLVAPVFEPETSRSVYLPKGKWVDFDNPAQYYKGAKRHTISAGLDKLPRFIRSNSILVRGNIYQGNDKRWSETKKSLELTAFPGEKNSKNSFTYVDYLKDNEVNLLTVESDGKTAEFKGSALGTDATIRVILEKKPKSIQNQNEAIDFKWEDGVAIIALKARELIYLSVEY
ncbi:Alpha-glucosidase, glycosyl hydrolase family GH31 [Alteromonadaceae bacterium Bs31]|nr:Alpha-glucosidase, glycosyl hydrolase family GH31 [Alteromonadaceae bacterium Bs31]